MILNKLTIDSRINPELNVNIAEENLMVLKSEAIKKFLEHSAPEDLAKLYSINMECQVNVAQDGGTLQKGEYRGRAWRGWTDGIQTWKSFRIPYKANTNEAEYTDAELKWDIVAHTEGIGMTGWDWKNKVSRWIAYDFDSLTQHSDGLSQEELTEITEKATEIPWVTTRYSSGGQGLHLYVFLEGVETNNHNEHAALARAILGKMSAITGFDFKTKVDICGGNMWVWHRKAKQHENAFKLVKSGTTLKDVPSNWRDHINVVKGSHKKSVPRFVLTNVDDVTKTEADSRINEFQELCGQYDRVKLDPQHKALLTHLEGSKALWWWDSDNYMLVGHTFDLQQAHKDMNLKGIFQTNSKGTEHGIDQNCFCYPLRKGAWVVRRHSRGVQEHESWEQDSGGWTKCYLNREPDLKVSSRAFEGIEDTKGAFNFRYAEQAIKAALKLGANISVPTWANGREAKLTEHKDGRVVIEVKKEDRDLADEMKGWLPIKGWWQRIVNVNVSSNYEPETTNYEDLIRHLVTEDGADYGWSIFSDSQWRTEPLTHIRPALESLSLGVKEIKNIIGGSIFKCWRLVNMPFQPEYPGDRKWNRDAARLKYAPSTDSRINSFEHWTKILDHVGDHLTCSVKENPWCVANGISTGAEYLKCWVASMFQEPLEPLPYLFLYSKEQNTGKSILHEALSLLMTKGYQRVDSALMSQAGFNGELAGSVLCVVEETDLSKNKQAYNKIKDWVTSKQLNIRELYRQARHTPNSCHFIQCSNDFKACPIFAGDTRITTMYVAPLSPIDLIPKKELLRKLEKEAPAFLNEVLHLELPPSNDRLNIPVIETEDKKAMSERNESLLDTFISEYCAHEDGSRIKFSDFFEEYVKWLDPEDAGHWTKIRVGKEIPPQILKARLAKTGQYHLGNVCWREDVSDEKKIRLVVKNGYLVEENSEEA